MNIPKINLLAGTRVLIGILLMAAIARWVIKAFGGVDIATYLALHPADVMKGYVWQLFSHALLPGGVFDLIINLLMIAFLGSKVEYAWSKNELVSYGLICALGAGLIKLAAAHYAPAPMVGSSCIVMGLVAAVFKLFGDEQTIIPGIADLPLRTFLAILIVANFIMVFVTAGFAEAFIQMGGFVAGLIYLTVRWQYNKSRQAKTSSSGRAKNLEI